MATAEKRGPYNYDNDPERPSPHLIIRKDKPFNAEPALSVLTRNYITPTNEFFKRNHGPIPDLSADTHKVFVSAPALAGAPQRSFSMAELHAMPRLEITAALQVSR
jgi:sulfite oxidase